MMTANTITATTPARPTELVAQSRTLDAHAIRLYAELTNDFNPIHVDETFAAATPFGCTIAHGTLTLALVWQAFYATFGRDVLAGAAAEIRFAKPVLVDTRVTAGGTLVVDELGERWQVEVRNDAGIAVLGGTVRLAPTATPATSHASGNATEIPGCVPTER